MKKRLFFHEKASLSNEESYKYLIVNMYFLFFFKNPFHEKTFL